MRLWHKDLIPHLPKQQLLGQWRELCCIATNLALNHTPNHILVNPIVNYPPEHFEVYCERVLQEMLRRGINVSDQTLMDLKMNVRAWRLYLDQEVPFDYIDKAWNLDFEEELFDGWHNGRYLRQCYYNLEEKYDRDGIPHDEWMVIFSNFGGC